MTDFENIYNEYFHDVYKYMLSLCQNETMAEEVTQTTFCKAMEGMNNFKGNCSHFVWLCQIAKNTYFTLYKKQKRDVSTSELDASLVALPNFENEYIDSETSKRLHQLLHELNEPYKEIFMLRVFGELPYSQIGELFGKTESWARLIFYRAKKELWRRLNEHKL
ncbi:sigma-70 family RNA polymerase sigma factor [Clostridium sp. D33t1_170424_F3]|uniref:RNA polymerase sigma factor n=1 Tax=Clostridium sp. D33t1_170424_F3 TaxID=2787099 RepID=UPI0018AB9C57|nr:sigma-70 family RNA polymerase sigma factor [Clostridium sp. D33t1_170424_F3]